MEELNEEEMLGAEGGSSATYNGQLIQLVHYTKTNLRFKVRNDVTGIWIKRFKEPCNIKLAKGQKIQIDRVSVNWTGPILSFTVIKGYTPPTGAFVEIEVWHQEKYGAGSWQSALPKKIAYRVKWSQ